MITMTLLVGLASSSPVHHHDSSEEVTSEDPWLMTSEGAGRSHLVMWMITEKQLIPRVHALADSATALLRCTCVEEGKPGVEECLALAASLPDFPGLSDVPSQQVLHNENKKTFVKTLLDNGYISLKQLKALLQGEVTPEGLGQCAGSHRTSHFMDSLQTATTQYHNMMSSFYKIKVTQPCKVEVPREGFASDRLLAIKLLHVAVNRLNQVSSALEYSVQFSWFSRLGASISGRGRRLRSKRKNRKGWSVQ
ncbi:hypothetical protein ACOMHN_035831 [Nucella lapillus]